MSNILGAVAATVVTVGVTNVIQSRRAYNTAQHWNSPLSRLGRSAILTGYTTNAINRTFTAINDVAAPDWITLPSPSALGGIERFTVISGEHLAMVETALGEDYIGAVRRVDEHAWKLSQQVDGTPVHRIVCRADTTDELRELPGPSGTPVTVTALPWLGGLLRRSLDRHTQPQPVDPHFRQLLSTTERIVVEHGNTYVRLTRELVQPTTAGYAAHPWWIVKDLYLDDGIPGTPRPGTRWPDRRLRRALSRQRHSADRHRRQRLHLATARLPAHLRRHPSHRHQRPHRTPVRTGPRRGAVPDRLPTDRVADFIRTTTVRGLQQHEVSMLYTPLPGWHRRPEPVGDGVSISNRMPQPTAP
jgi:hypothetical protein